MMCPPEVAHHTSSVSCQAEPSELFASERRCRKRRRREWGAIVADLPQCPARARKASARDPCHFLLTHGCAISRGHHSRERSKRTADRWEERPRLPVLRGRSAASTRG